MTWAPWFRGETTTIRPGRSVSTEAAVNAPSIRVIVRTESEKAMTVEPAPDRQAPIAPASRADWTSRGSCGKTAARYCSWSRSTVTTAQQVEAPDRHPGDADGQPGQVGDGVLARDLVRQDRLASPSSTGAAPG